MRTLDPVKHEEKRGEILHAAWRCMARSGFRGTSTADICKEAGISPGHLYHYFDSKEAIVTALTTRGLQGAEARFGEMMKNSNALTAMLSELDRHKSRDKNSPKNGQHGDYRTISLVVLEMLVEAGRNPAIAKIIRANTRKIKSLLVEFLKSGQERGQIDPGLDAEVAASLLLSVMDGMKTIGIREPKSDTTRNIEYLQILISRFLSPPRL
jgi:AcrR family transcriptional regulator